MPDSVPDPTRTTAAATLREIRRAAPGPIGRWRNRLAMRLFRLIATSGLVERTNQDRVDAARWHAHVRRREMGFVRCEENVDAT